MTLERLNALSQAAQDSRGREKDLRVAVEDIRTRRIKAESGLPQGQRDRLAAALVGLGTPGIAQRMMLAVVEEWLPRLYRLVELQLQAKQREETLEAEMIEEQLRTILSNVVEPS